MTKKVDLNALSVSELMLLQVEVNNLVLQLRDKAQADLDAGKANRYFKMKAGKSSRYIKETGMYKSILEEAFEENFADLCTEVKVIALTNAEKLIKREFDEEDAKKLLKQINDCTDKKVSAPTLVYSPQD